MNTLTHKGPQQRSPAAFNLTELLVVVAVIGLITLLHAAASPRLKARSETSVCLSNHRRLMAACLLYAHENHDMLPGNTPGGGAATNEDWCTGWLDFTGGTDNTNYLKLFNSQLGPYTGRAKEIYKCPADNSLSRGVLGQPRVRSVSMNQYMGANSQPYTSGYRAFKSFNDITDPSPAKAWVFIDEREDSINDACFAVDMSSYSPSRPAANIIVDFPADWHDQGVDLSFADGHAENWHWQDARTMPPHIPGQLIPLGIPSPTNLDVTRLQGATSRKTQ